MEKPSKEDDQMDVEGENFQEERRPMKPEPQKYAVYEKTKIVEEC